MATWYVSKTGSDTTPGNGSLANPWLTIDKAIGGNGSLAAGDVILIGDGTYDENSASLGYLSLSKALTPATNPVLVKPLNGASGAVTIRGASSNTASMLIGTASGFYFQNLTFASRVNTVQAVVRNNGANISGITFDSCLFSILSDTTVRYGFSFGSNSGSASLAFLNCTMTADNNTTVQSRGINCLANGTGVYNNITVKDCIFNVGNNPIVISGGTGHVIDGNECNGFFAGGGGYGVLLGSDGYDTTAATSGVVTNNYLNPVGGHGGIFGGNNTTNVTFKGNRIIGGNTGAAGQGMVVKSNGSGCSVVHNVIYDGYNSGLYLKAAQNLTAKYNIIFNRYADQVYSSGIRFGQNVDTNGNTYKCAGNTLRRNVVVCAPTSPSMFSAGHAMYWEGLAGDDGTSTTDYNQYYLMGNSVWGTIYGNAVNTTSLSALRTAWQAAPVAERGNDANSGNLGDVRQYVYKHSATGALLFAMISNEFGDYWDGTAFSFPTTSIGNYVYPMAEYVAGSYRYHSLFNQDLPAGTYTVEIFSQAGKVAKPSDTRVYSQVYAFNGQGGYINPSQFLTAGQFNALK